MIKIKFYGKLSKDIGLKEIEAECYTVGELMNYLHYLTNGDFARKLISNRNDGIPYAGVRGGKEFLLKSDTPLVDGEEISFAPMVGMSGLETLVSATTYNIIVQVSISLALSAAFALLSMLLAPAPPQVVGEGPATKRKEAYLFDGRARTVNQGSCVPVGYGRMIIPGSVIYNRVEYVRI